jgi:integrase
MSAYQAALSGVTATQKQIGQARTVPETVHALVAAYLDCSTGASSPFKTLAPETQRTQRNILENFREAHGRKRIYSTDRNGNRTLLLNSQHVQRIVNQKNHTPFAQRNFLNTLRAMFKWAVAEGRVPDDPTLGVTRQKITGTGYQDWSEERIAQYKSKYPLGTMGRLAVELFLATGCRRGDAVRLGPQHMQDGGITGKSITFQQSKTKGTVIIPLHPNFLEALAAMPPSNVAPLTTATTFITTSYGRPFQTAASFGNWFRERCNEAGLPKGFSAHGLRKATARRLAELGCTAHQISAITGHTTLSEVERYTREANKKHLAEQAIKKLIEDKTQTSTYKPGG